MKLSKLLQLNEQVYQNGSYMTNRIIVNADEIAAVRQEHRYNDATEIVMKSGVRLTVADSYDTVRELILEAVDERK